MIVSVGLSLFLLPVQPFLSPLPPPFLLVCPAHPKVCCRLQLFLSYVWGLSLCDKKNSTWILQLACTLESTNPMTFEQTMDGK